MNLNMSHMPLPQKPMVDIIEEVNYSTVHNLRIICMSDAHCTHNEYGIAPKCDLFVYAGDIFRDSRNHSEEEALELLEDFNVWLGTIDASMRIVIAGNHDTILEHWGIAKTQSILTNAVYLCNTWTTFVIPYENRRINIFGTPYSCGTKTSQNRAFQSVAFRKNMLHIIDNGPKIDILITHGPTHFVAQHAAPTIAHIWGHVHQCRNVYRIPLPGQPGQPGPDYEYFVMKRGEFERLKSENAMKCDGNINAYYHHTAWPPSNLVFKTIPKIEQWVSICCCVLSETYNKTPRHIPYLINL
jgi:hypothetical protein